MGGRSELTADGSGLRATLADDRGTAAETDDFFRSRPFYDAEGVTHTLRIEGAGEIALPLVVREIAETGLSDASSPYGYPGASVNGGELPPDPGAIDWSQAGLVSVFVRDRIGHPPVLEGARAAEWCRCTTPVARGACGPGSRSRSAATASSATASRSSPDATPPLRSGLPSMPPTPRPCAAPRRRRATFSSPGTSTPCFVSSVPGSCSARSPKGATGAGAIAALSDGLLHYYLGGTVDAHLDDSPFKNVVEAMIELAQELGVRLNLGGGVRAGDGLEDFKRGFANAELAFNTHEIVCDPAAYQRLAQGRDDPGFFPVYRAGAA